LAISKAPSWYQQAERYWWSKKLQQPPDQVQRLHALWARNYSN